MMVRRTRDLFQGRARRLRSLAIALALICIARSANAQTTQRTGVRVIDHALSKDASAYWHGLPEGYPARRGFRAPILDRAGLLSLFGDLEPTAPLQIRTAFDWVGHHLPTDGLLATTAHVLAIPQFDRRDLGDDAMLDQLESIGIPIDLLGFFIPDADIDGPSAQQVGSGAHDRTLRTLHAIRALAKSSGEDKALRARLATWLFSYRQSVPGFRLLSDSGEHAIGVVRLQLTRGSDWAGVGDGGCVDVARQLMAQLPAARFVASIEKKRATDAIAEIERWPADAARRMTFITEELPVAQWARDSAAVGIAETDGEAKRSLVTLVPRFATRGEAGAIFVPSESLLADGLAASGLSVASSPLLFQGGDLICVREPANGHRVILIGEAEVNRNIALGLSRPQALEAIRGEFGVNQCLVLPAASFHIDFEVSIRAVGDHVVALVNDEPAAVRMVLTCAIDMLDRKGRLGPDAAAAARKALANDHFAEFADAVGPMLQSATRGPGRFAESLADSLSTGKADSGVGNLQCFLRAMDVWASAAATGDLPGDAALRAYLGTFAQPRADRAAILKTLDRPGWTTVSIPSMGSSRRGINYLNGVHEPGRFYMPAYGGLFEPLDRKAQAAIASALGTGVAITPILSGETQRREGGVRCSVSVYPAQGGN